ncbi:hypothetical protein [Pseudoduganella sp. HUAS MS19]
MKSNIQLGSMAPIMQLGDNMLRWNIRSSSGRDSFTCTFIRVSTSDQSYVLAEIAISGLQFERDRSAMFAESILDYEVTLHQVVLRIDRLELLLKALGKWFESQEEVSIELSEFCGQYFQLLIGALPGLISSKEKPAFAIRYTGGTISSADLAFVVDQSCLRTCYEELNTALLGLKALINVSSGSTKTC